MTDAQVQSKLNQLVKLCNELQKEAKERYGPSGSLFYESEGAFHMMANDTSGRCSERQENIRFSSTKHCTLGAGAW